jgi:curved DNA-binding protein
MAPRTDFYERLGLPRDAPPDEIQSAYRRLARTYHPDVNKDPGAEERFKEISEAYDVLSDPDTRRRYDTFGPDFRNVPEGVDPRSWARANAGSRPGGRAPGGRGGGDASSGEWFVGGFGDEGVDIDDLLGGLFNRSRRGGGFNGWGSVPGADQEAELELSVEEAYRGGKRSISLSGGSGTRTYDVTIPPGVTDGQRIRLAGQGGRGGGDAPAGDLFLVVRIAPHPRYRVEGRDLHVTLPVSPWEAALGTTAAVETPGGEVKVRVPAGTSSGRRLRLRRRGMPNPNGKPGDLYAEVRILVPESLSDDERRLFEELAKVSTFDPRRRR